MNRKYRWLWGLGLLSAVLLAIASPRGLNLNGPLLPAIAQSPDTPAATPTAIPQVPVAPSVLPTPPAPPASTAPPLQLGSTYQDPAGRFKVGILKNYKASPFAGSVLIEAPDGQLAYAVVAKAQPLGNPIGTIGYDASDSLAKVAIEVFQRGEGFQPGPPRAEAGGGAVMDWTGGLTINNRVQPVSGVILARPNSQTILLLLIAATQTGQSQVPGALAALATSLEPL